MGNMLSLRSSGKMHSSTTEPIRISIKCKQKSSKVLCQFSFTNITNGECYLLRYNTPLEGLRSSFLNLKNQKINDIPYQGILVKRLLPKKENYVLLKPNKPIQSPDIDLTKAYQFPHDGEYTLQYTRDLVYITKEKMESIKDDELPIWSRKFRPRLSSCRFTVVNADKFKKSRKKVKHAKIIDASRFEGCSDIPSEECLTPQFVNGNASQKAMTTALHKELCSSNGYPKVILSLNRNNFLYKLWFGITVTKSCRQVKRFYQASLNGLKSDTITYDFQGKRCKRDTVAYTKHGARKVHLCPAFDSLPAKSVSSGQDSKQQTLVHEFSHVYSNTRDHAYGSYDCQNLAKENPDYAMDNADTFGYYFCDVFNA
ncbi:PREDICTED: uncharacterized protein LOC105312595 [Amphimedon queenslandica]|uniref:Lysine-specific metallo-endopeptidase domain-containing protein n=1 Tax=Amphimedon queenslandica TaxID=400682 RepID=A0A1X7V0K6_AMPQE|nr:PREDICTED: uncharacterized protein LOC105312595 [Amphimedon queenslandica]|eukprot:XP_011403667.2 PREDICTED: uncharacterized protein LOC105312595 [Amphimedon queenslandica]